MNEHLFRGKTKATHEWVYGGLFVSHDRYFIIKSVTYNCGQDSWGAFEIDPLTASRCTGLLDKDKKDIYEGDFILFRDELLLVYWNSESFQWQAKKLNAEYLSKRFPEENWDYIDLGWLAAEYECTGKVTLQVHGNIYDEILNIADDDDDCGWGDDDF
jgi:hypothetical protein